MTDRELKRYALTGILIRLEQEKDKLEKQNDEEIKNKIKNRINKLQEHYTEIVNELQ